MEEKDFAVPVEGTAQESNDLFTLESLVFWVLCLNGKRFKQ